MKILKHLAAKRGVTHFSLGGVELPLEIALDNDQMTPLLIAATGITLANSMYMPNCELPWQIVETGGDQCLIDGVTIEDAPTDLPMSIALLFLDYQVESLIAAQMLEFGLTETPSCISLDPIAKLLEDVPEIPAPLSRDPLAKSVMSYV